MYQKLKGLVKERTLMRILHGEMAEPNRNATETAYLKKDDTIFYRTKISAFFAERKDKKYWLIYQVLGE